MRGRPYSHARFPSQDVFHTVTRGGAKVEDVLGSFRAGESLDALAQEYGVPVAEFEDVLRVATSLAT